MTELTGLLHELLQHNNHHVSWLANIITMTEKFLNEGNITQAEYDVIMLDIKRTKKIIEKSNDIQVNTKINQAIMLLAELAKYAKL